jgi:hypothetical protein
MKKGKIKQELKVLKKEWKNILFNCLVALLALIITSLFYRNIILTSFLLGILSIIGLVKWKSWLTFSIFLFGMVFGPLSEMIAINLGAWEYAVNNVKNIPLWLFLLWGLAAAFIFEIAMEIKKLGVKDN